MGKGVIWGGVSGLLAGVALLAIASLSAPVPEQPRLALPGALTGAQPGAQPGSRPETPPATELATGTPDGVAPETATGAGEAAEKTAEEAGETAGTETATGGTETGEVAGAGAGTGTAPTDRADAVPPAEVAPEPAPGQTPVAEAPADPETAPLAPPLLADGVPPAPGTSGTTAMPAEAPPKVAPEPDTATDSPTDSATDSTPGAAPGAAPPADAAVEVPGASDFARAGEDRAPVSPAADAGQPAPADPAALEAAPRDASPDPGAALPAPDIAPSVPEAPADTSRIAVLDPAPPAAGLPPGPMALPTAPPPALAPPAAAPGDRPALAVPEAPLEAPPAPANAPAADAPAATATLPTEPPPSAPLPTPSGDDLAEAPRPAPAGVPGVLPEPGTGFRPVPGLGSSGPQPGFAPAPRLGLSGAPATTATAPDGTGTGTGTGADDGAAGSPLALRRNAAASAPASGPEMSVLLMDEGAQSRPDPRLLADLPFPVTVAVDPAAPGAAAAAEAYRAAGLEVAILAGSVPDGATPADLETAWQAFLYEVPEAIAVLDGPAARLQNDRPLARQLVTLAASGGYGLLSWDTGMNPLAQIAETDDVPELRIYRRLDAAGEEAPVIARYLDRAAFEATRSPGIIVAGAARPATIAALLDWAVGQRRGLTLVPVSQQLQQQLD
ncbi:divergent polysaccharide deacetylase family protein [Frigidibacter sp. MR17.24]|uniref:divergent polysaccharide deacetylase family protein n=1 Tax=Frigidibacter sp. MR17.24 TaxID=3127345 RepID=UPI0030129D53